jgi:hypothetical protein
MRIRATAEIHRTSPGLVGSCPLIAVSTRKSQCEDQDRRAKKQQDEPPCRSRETTAIAPSQVHRYPEVVGSS